ncbi:MAG TPA: NAD(P)H-dependent oxidoreductase, partial [Steroidobacteraceae bacterium]|nr:NAD(P)H-dependent oxidoreductase [Steroidobacteraceae bacterium]
MNLLHIDSSILGEKSASRALSREIVSRWQSAIPALEVTYLDLAASPISHLGTAVASEPDAVALASERDSSVLEDFLRADVIVIGAPMYNFGVPSQLKAWIDRILVAGKTFRYTEAGPLGLASGKRVVVALSQGGVLHPGDAGEHVETYLRHVFQFVGITDVTFVRAKGLAMSPESRQKGLDAAF